MVSYGIFWSGQFVFLFLVPAFPRFSGFPLVRARVFQSNSFIFRSARLSLVVIHCITSYPQIIIIFTYSSKIATGVVMSRCLTANFIILALWKHLKYRPLDSSTRFDLTFFCVLSKIYSPEFFIVLFFTRKVSAVIVL